MNYYRNGKQVLHRGGVSSADVSHVADATDEEQAGQIVAALNGSSVQYMKDASVTLSPSWHGDKVSMTAFKGGINDAIEAANRLDQVKKTLFYGRDNNLIADGQQPLGESLLDAMGDGNADPRNVVHGIIGIFTEAGELLEALVEAYNGNGLDPVNLREEVGDMFWYVAILFAEASKEADGYTFEEAMRLNIAKLKARFPAAFEADYANNRDLDKERQILEGGKLEDSFNGFNTDVPVVKNPDKPGAELGEPAKPQADKPSTLADDIKKATGADNVSTRRPIGDCEGMDA